MRVFNHMFDIAFSLDTSIEDPHEVPLLDLIRGLERRLEAIKASAAKGNRAEEAFGHCDTYEKSI